jgi:uncharacterized RDD family membrane protein YckC
VREHLPVTYEQYAPPRDPTAVVGRRILAYVIDWFIVGVISFIAISTTLDGYEKSEFFTGFDLCDGADVAVCFEDDDNVYVFEEGSDAVIGIGLPIAAWIGNHVVLQGITGASVGKFVTKLRVVNRNGTNAGVGRALVRSVFLVIDAGCFVIGLVTMLTTKGHRRVGDMVGNTYVVGAQDVGTPPEPTPGFGPPPAGYTPPTGWTPPGAGETPAWAPPPSGPPPAAPPPGDPNSPPSNPWGS